MNVLIDLLMLAAMFACMAAVGFFSGTESGMLTVSRARLLSLDRQGVPRAKRLAGVISDMPTVINTVLIGTNLFSVIASTLSASLALRLFRGSAVAQSSWSVFVALLVLFGCEYMPKLLFTTRPLRRTLYVTPYYCFAEKALSPLTSVFAIVVRAIFHTPAAGSRRITITRDNLRSLVADRVNGARIDDFSRRMIDRILTLQTMFASDPELMTPIERTDKVLASAPLTECVALARRTGHVHLPVFESNGREAVGMLDIFKLLREEPYGYDELRAADRAVPPIVIAATTRADDILPMMRRRRQATALVRDEDRGIIIGIVTEEQVLLALTGILKED